MDFSSPTWCLAMLLGLVAVAIEASGYLNRNDATLFRRVALGNLAYGLSLLLLGGWAGFVLALLGSLRYWVASNERLNHDKWFPWLLFLQALGAILVWRSPADGLALTGSLLATYAAFQLKDSITMRLTLCGVFLCFLIYGYVTGAYTNMLVDVIGFAATVAGIIRLDLAKKKAA